MRTRIRSLKPEIWQDEKVSRLAPYERLLFVGLITLADDHGRMPELERVILGHVFPRERMSTKRVNKLLEKLATVGLIVRYQVDGDRFIALPGWSRHQRVDKAQPPRIPAPPEPEVHPDQGLFFDERSAKTPGGIGSRSGSDLGATA